MYQMLCSLLKIEKKSKYLCLKGTYSLGGITSKCKNSLASEKNFQIHNYKPENQKETGNAWGDEWGGER